MFGFGKKSTDTKNPEAKKQEHNNAVPAEPVAAIPDDKFVVMPAQYLPQSSGRASSSPGRGINKKVLLLGGGGALALAAFAAVLYVVFLSEPKQPSVASPAPQQQEVPEEDVLEEEPEPAAESESIVRA
ncbi:MAG: hypothetical protein U1C18_02035, partial [Patescibacteria group bacterium]|nr:hypothetical protein [Patescibacteria group bacterium]